MPVTLEIVSPAKLLLSREVDMVVVPSAEGDLAAQENHAPMIVLLRGGVITVYDGGKAGDQFFVAGGFAEITGDRCTVLADQAVPVAELSRDAARARLDDAEKGWENADKQDIAVRDAALDRLLSAREEVRLAG